MDYRLIQNNIYMYTYIYIYIDMTYRQNQRLISINLWIFPRQPPASSNERVENSLVPAVDLNLGGEFSGFGGDEGTPFAHHHLRI